MWIARDKDGDLFIYDKKPWKNEYIEMWECASDTCYPPIRLDKRSYPEVRWEDEEPCELVLVAE